MEDDKKILKVTETSTSFTSSGEVKNIMNLECQLTPSESAVHGGS
jgi:hypothetical protein